jgi:deazaflavin-dependent oxidoreductase (nitroreductase family)
MADYNTSVIEEFRSNKGKVSGPFEGMELLLLTNTGAKSGKEFVIPLVYTEDGDNLVIIASKGGAPSHPDWYHNLIANPKAKIEVGEEKFEVIAKPTSGEERERLYEQHATKYPNFNEYKANTTREIPVFLLEKI